MTGPRQAVWRSVEGALGMKVKKLENRGDSEGPLAGGVGNGDGSETLAATQ